MPARKPVAQKTKPKSENITQAAYALRINVERQYIYKLRKQGKILLEPDGKVNPEKTDARLKALRDASRDPLRTSVFPDDPEAVEDLDNYNRFRTIREGYKARMAKLEYERESGLLVNRREMASALFVASRTMRDKVLAVSKRISALAAGESDPAKVETMLHDEFTEALMALSERDLRDAFGSESLNEPEE